MKILFVCTHNRCRSILSEAIGRHLASEESPYSFRSAGSQPAGEVHPLTLHFLASKHIAIAGLQSQGWDEFEQWQPDVVITVCDSAAGEQCPLWLGKAIKVHWGLADPSAGEGDAAQKASAFAQVMDTISTRLQALLASDIATLPASEQQQQLQALGK